MKKFVVPVAVGLLASVLPIVQPIAVGAPTAQAAGVGRFAAGLPSDAAAYTPVTPARLADTRSDMGSFGFTRLGPTTIRVQVTGREGIPGTATAAVLNIASVNGVGAGFVTAYPAGTTRPLAASLNIDTPNQIVANLTTVRLGAGGAVDLYTNVPMDLVVDVAGSYSPVTGPVRAGRLVTISGGAKRAYDSREVNERMGARTSRVIDLSSTGVPDDAVAVAINLAAVDSAGPGYWVAYPTGNALPVASSLNLDAAGQTRNSQGVVRVNPGTRSITVYSYGGGDLVVDVVGWFTGDSGAPSTDGLFVTTAPTRALDTRDTFNPAPWGGTTVEFNPLAPSGLSVAAVAMNIAITEPWYVGFVTAYPAGVARPFAANLNVTAFDQIISNHAIVRNGTRGIALYTQNGTHMVVDVAGWYLGTPDASTEAPPAIPHFDPTWAVSVQSSAPLNVGIGYGSNIDAIINRGVAGLWSGRGELGAPDRNVYFAHRTSHGGPFRYLDRMPVGSRFVLVGASGVKYTYLVQRVDVIVPAASLLVDIITKGSSYTATLVACHPAGSTRYRIAVTGRLIGASAP